MAKIEWKGLDELTRAISRLELHAKDQVIGPAVFEGAAIVADEVRQAIEDLPTDSGFGSPDHVLRGPNQAQKDGLMAAFGVAPMREDDGIYNVKLGFDGYNNIKTKRWPKGQPNAMVARSVERGTSFMAANKFIQKAIRRARARAEGRMKLVVDEKIRAIMKK